MNKIVLLAVVASMAVAASASASTSALNSAKVLTASASHVVVKSQSFNPFGSDCSARSVSYQLVGKDTKYFVEFSGVGACANSTSPWTTWSYGGTTPKGWMLSGFSYQPLLRVPLASLGKFNISFTVGDDQIGSQTCSFSPNFKFGYNAKQLCH